MKKRLFAFLLTLALLFSVLPGAVFAAESAAPEEVNCGILDAARSKLTRLSGLTRTETYEISDSTRNEVISKIVTGLKNRSAKIDVSGYGLTIEEVYDLYNEVLDAHYEFFYVQNASYSSSWIQPLYDTTYTSSDVTTFNNLCSAIVAGIPQGTNAEKLLYLHDYLITHCEYDLSKTKRDAYAALVEGSAVCEGYAKAFKYLCDLSGLTCEYVSSDAIDHAWNMVQVGGGDTAWYYVDCTWDDPINGSSLLPESNCRHANFLMSREACINTNHASSDWVNGKGESVYNRTTSTKYDSYWWRALIRSVQWVGTQMCYAKPTDLSHVYFRSSGSSSETSVTIQGGGNRWNVLGESSSYWTDSYITIASQGGAFYYSTPTQIWKLTTGGAMSLTYTLTSAEQKKGYIYGIQGGANKLTYYIGQDPNHASVAANSLNIPSSSASTTPVLVSATASPNQIKVTWNGVNGASKYAVYRKTAGGSWNRLTNTVTGTTYTDNSTDLVAGTTYYYTVKAYVSGTWSGYDSQGVSAKAVASTIPVLKSATASAGQITVTWNAVTNATKYAVYRKTAGGSWTCLTTSATGTSYVDKSVAAGTTYSYTVKSLVSGTWSGYDKTGVSAKAVASAIPVLKSAMPSAGQITVQWNAVTNTTKYAVYRKTQGGSWTLLTTSATGISYVDKSGLTAGTTYYYTVKAQVGGAWSGYYASGVSATAK